MSILLAEVSAKDAPMVVGFLLAFKGLMDQIDMNDYKDAQGHQLKMNVAYINLATSVDDILKEWEKISEEE